jgi:hypothetical protein
MLTTGAATPPTLDGLHLIGASADSWEVTETELVGTIRMANGATREQRLAPDPGAPVIRRWYGVTLDYRHLGPLAEEVEARLAFPGPHDLTLWKHITLGYLADGTRTEWTLPWRLAPHLLTPPAGAPPERFRPTVRLGWGGPLLDATFDPEAPRFQLPTAPPAEARLIVQVVPLFAMVTAAEDQTRRYRDPLREPRRITLVETELP